MVSASASRDWPKLKHAERDVRRSRLLDSKLVTERCQGAASEKQCDIHGDCFVAAAVFSPQSRLVTDWAEAGEGETKTERIGHLGVSQRVVVRWYLWHALAQNRSFGEAITNSLRERSIERQDAFVYENGQSGYLTYANRSPVLDLASPNPRNRPFVPAVDAKYKVRTTARPNVQGEDQKKCRGHNIIRLAWDVDVQADLNISLPVPDNGNMK
ncbi:uncharacterized protein SPSK_01915 [Sporothrix schenckii 1099-18]|uniref:Uncharacterized protein n=1 Tax=Sporothrix schenckii 1099-18 TaxID=1397361 RepID=A0A0F2MCQ5_SPOSC|nr:uncharacterized protein SPSK_01915 [Sporothrix schenckii 1099-18]KJR87458.1 hypothetical protein SPSK_01915 [Sporothrix schenckii 1099-18]